MLERGCSYRLLDAAARHTTKANLALAEDDSEQIDSAYGAVLGFDQRSEVLVRARLQWNSMGMERKR